MNKKKYEVMFLFKPLLFEELKNSVVKEVEKIVKDNKGEIKEVDFIGKQKLAYPVKDKFSSGSSAFTEGHYVEYEMQLEPNMLKYVKQSFTLQKDVLRVIVICK